jgi:hypothetical protein
LGVRNDLNTKEGVQFVKRRVKTLYLLPLLTLGMLVLALMGPLSASAATISKTHLLGTKQQIRPFSVSSGSKLLYYGGSVMKGTAKAYAIFWEPTGSYVSKTYNSLILQYFGDVGGSRLYYNNTQYKDSGGNFPSNASLGGSWVDTAKYPSTTLSDLQVQNEVTHAQSVNGWTSSVDNIFFVFTAKGENICSGGQCSFTTFCAYHGNLGKTIYATMPYTGTNLSACGVTHSPNGDVDADSTINVTSHEQMEAATDPYLNAWIDASGNEIGDKCAWNFGTLNSRGGDVSWNGHAYYVQKEWDNKAHRCRLTGP